MKLRKLEPKEHGITRRLYEEAFPADPKDFVDYYYSEKTKDNEIFVIEDESVVTMLHLNPYKMRIEDNIYDTNYIVAVATSVPYRRRGLMGQILKATMRVMHDRKEPFTFLMPEAEAIYYPYDFRNVHKRVHGFVAGKNFGKELKIVEATEADFKELVEFSNQILSGYQVTVLRTERYFEILLQEMICDNGKILMVYEKEQLIGWFGLYQGEEDILLRTALFKNEEDFSQVVYDLVGEKEVLCEGDGESWKPYIMARILHLETFIRAIHFPEGTKWFVELEDHFIEENNGKFCIGGENGFERLDESQEGCEKLDIGTFTERVFSEFLPKVFINEIV